MDFTKKDEKMERYVQVNGLRYTESELKLMSVSELTNIINEIQIELNNITLKIKSHGKGNVSQYQKIRLYLQNSLILASMVRKEKKLNYNDRFNTLFVENAKKLLDEEVFKRIEDSVKDYIPMRI